MEKTKSAVCTYLPDALMHRARRVSARVGVPICRLVADGLVKQVERFEAMMVLSAEEEEVEI